MWVEMNTHTHANWVFTKPGRHVIDVQIDSQFTDGRQVSATEQLVFQVGSDAADIATQDSANSLGDEGDQVPGARHGENRDKSQSDRRAHSASSSARPSREANKTGKTESTSDSAATDPASNNRDNAPGGMNTGLIALIIGLFAVAIGLLVAALLIRRRRTRDEVMRQSQKTGGE